MFQLNLFHLILFQLKLIQLFRNYNGNFFPIIYFFYAFKFQQLLISYSEICTRRFQKPFSMKCGHIFCFTCILPRLKNNITSCFKCRSESNFEFIPVYQLDSKNNLPSYSDCQAQLFNFDIINRLEVEKILAMRIVNSKLELKVKWSNPQK